MTKIRKNTSKNQIKSNIFYIDSAKFLADSSLFDKIEIPNNIIEVDGDTGETLREFKRNSLQIEYKGFNIYISNYTKVLRKNTYKKFMLLFSAKVSNRYLAGINYNDFVEVLSYLRRLQYIDYKDSNLVSIIEEFYTKDTDIAYNIVVPTSIVPQLIEQWKYIRKNSKNKDQIKIGNAKNNQMLQFGKRGDKYFFKIYNKSLEVRSDLEELMKLPLTDDERDLFLENENTMFRIEITIRNKKDFKDLNTSSKLVDLWQILELKNQDISKMVRKYYDEMTGHYKPKIRTIGKLTNKDKITLSYLKYLYDNGKKPNDMIELTLMLFESNTNVERMTKSREKKQIIKLIDYLYSNIDEVAEKQAKNTMAYEYIKQMFFLEN